MAIVTQYPAGAPCWFELATTDQAAAKQFYTQLFGWSAEDSPMGPDAYYTMFKLGGRDTAAAYLLGPQEQGVPPHWNIYFSTSDADATIAKVKDSGGSVLAGPFDVMEHGRMAVCSDPGGASFCIWQPKNHFGAGVINEDNTFCWAELATWDAAQAKPFYESVFGWDIKENPAYNSESAGNSAAVSCRWMSNGRGRLRSGDSTSKSATATWPPAWRRISAAPSA